MELKSLDKKYLVPVILVIAAVGGASILMDGSSTIEEETDPRENMSKEEVCSRLGAQVEGSSGSAQVENTGSVKIYGILMVWNGDSSGRKNVTDLEIDESREISIDSGKISEIKLVSHDCGNKILDTYRQNR